MATWNDGDIITADKMNALQTEADTAGATVNHLVKALGITGDLGDELTAEQLAAVKAKLGITTSA